LKKDIRRRSFLRMILGGIVAGYASGGIGAIRLRKPTMPRRSLNGKLSYGVFAALVGENFTITHPELQTEYRARAQLVEAKIIFLSSENDQFYLVFRVDEGQVPPNGICRIHHTTAGKASLFLQSMGTDFPGNYCRAEFNLLL
jgi:hypothetical protein